MVRLTQILRLSLLALFVESALLYYKAVPDVIAPVYGSIPAGHENVSIWLSVPIAIGTALLALKRNLEDSRCFLAAWMPFVLEHLLSYSGKLGPSLGPLLHNTLARAVILCSVAMTFAEAWKQCLTWRYLTAQASTLLIIIVLRYSFSWFEAPVLDTLRWSENPLNKQIIFSTAATLMCRSWVAGMAAAPALIMMPFTNPHFTTSAVNAALHTHNWTLLERRWSNTGYISVLDSFDEQYRVLRCDHSLLGGEWLLTEKRKKEEGWRVNEPIYAVFEMLEAVRLLQMEPAILDKEANALFIGLGIGTAPKAFMEHGISTTIVELDPVVHDFATRYFALPTNHTSIIQDAVTWTREAVTQNAPRFDYIIHDVFTGGAEPLALFNTEFLGHLRNLLKPNGAIALNYAGDLSLPLTRLVLRTITSTFNGQCKIFRDSPPETQNDGDDSVTTDSAGAKDFLNMVVFCRNSQGPITFRVPTRADFLGSQSRRYYMLPKPDHEIQFPFQSPTKPHISSSSSSSMGVGADDDDDDVRYNAATAQPPAEQAEHEDTAPQILELGDETKFTRQQLESAMRHWHIMRHVLPEAVWELW